MRLPTREEYHSLTLDEKISLISKFTAKQFQTFRYGSDLTLRDNQLVPENYFGRYFLAQCGRGWGKTKMGAYWVKTKIQQKAKGISVVAPTYRDLEDTLIPAIIAEFPQSERPRYIGGNKNYLIAKNGIKVYCYTSEQEIRGPNLSYVWCDEIAKWCSSSQEKVKERFQTLDLACRKGRAQFLITSTPKEWEFFYTFEKRFQAKDPNVHIVYGTIDENVHLSPDAKEALIAEHRNTRWGDQELDGKLLRDNPNALWSSSLLERQNITAVQFDHLIKENHLTILRSVVSADPAVSTNPNSDETGIIVASLCSDNKVYIREDASGKHSPSEWAKIATALYRKYNASHVVLESNQGGNLLEQAIRNADRYTRVQLIHASVGKKTRFEPVVGAYEQGDVYHVGNLYTLEKQMLSYNPYTPYSKSPDRIDAVSYCVYYLLLGEKKPIPRSAKAFAAW